MRDLPEMISSAGNPAVKRLRSLDRKKGRREHGVFLAEGARLISEGLDNGWEIDTVVFGAEALEAEHTHALIERAIAAGARPAFLNARLLGQVAKKENPQTVLGAFRPLDQSDRQSKLTNDNPGTWLALYRVRDPGNLGTIIRTADFAGVNGVVLLGDCCDPYSIESVRASMGSLFSVPFWSIEEPQAEDWLKSLSVPIIAASMNGTVPHHKAGYEESCLILMGNEQSGLPEQIERACTTLARIPMREGADSLNLANATALMVYAAWEQRGYPNAV